MSSRGFVRSVGSARGGWVETAYAVAGSVRFGVQTDGVGWRVLMTTPDAGRYLGETRHPTDAAARAEVQRGRSGPLTIGW